MLQANESRTAEILIVGAGPTGLVLALCLTKLGIPLRIIDKNSGPGLASRAMTVHARTLEFYHQLGFADEVVSKGIKMDHIFLRKQGKSFAAFELNNMGQGISPFPFMLCFPQDDHERFLVDKLKQVGVSIEWGVELKEFTQTDSHVHAVLNRSGTDEVCEVAYLCGCDGAHSRVRQQLKLEFPGGTYNNMFYVADVKIVGEFQTSTFMNLAAGGFALMLPVRSSGMQRLIGVVPESLAGRTEVVFEDIRDFVERILCVQVAELNWFATYRVHHRVAEHFRIDRCFLSGDAGHVHSPAGGQGMNTGIGDAVNLSWKLAMVLRGKAAASILDTYETERIAFARTLVSSTDRLFQGVSGRGIFSRLLRTILIPYLMPVLTSFARIRRLIFRTVSQVRIQYHDSAISKGQAGKLRGGDRLPWVQIENSDNFESLKSFDWQVHIYGIASQNFTASINELELPVIQFPWNNATEKAGIQRDACYLIRPDGYIALASPSQDPQIIVEYMSRISPRAHVS